jgi:hypothetical protein
MVMRTVAAVAVLVSAAVHLIMWFNGVRDQSVGPAFLLNAAGGVVIAALLLLWNHWLPPLLAIGFGASTLGAFVIATTVGLFGVHDHWQGGTERVGTWRALDGRTMRVTAATATDRRDIRSVQVRTADGHPVLELTG